MDYTKEQLRQVQNTELEILVKFDEICKKYDIKYQLFGGTLLGAVRHRGFIPWDDDIDVCMLRSEYEKFIRLCSNDDLNSMYFLQTNKTDPASVVQFAKLRKNNTVFEPENEVGSTSHKGIYIDIFPLDNVKPGTKEGKKQYKDFYKYYSIVTSTVKSRVTSSKTAWKKMIRYCLYGITRVIPKSYFDNKLHDILTQFDNEETEYINHLTNGTDGKRTKWFLMKRTEHTDMIKLEFEGHMFPAPRAYDALLTRRYGDYLKLPPVAERKPHHGIVRLEL